MIETMDYFKTRENLSSIVVNYIKESILSGYYKAGDHILETEVALKLNISRAPVREAIRELESDGIVITKPRKGTFVTAYSIDDIKEVFDIRLLLENNIYKILIYEDKLKEKDFMHLEHLVKDMESIATSGMSEEEKTLQVNIKDMAFHKFIWNKSGSLRRVKILEGIFFQLRMAMLYDMDETGNLIKSVTDHYEIIKALRSKDIDACKKALRRHIITYENEDLK
ncbi:MAG: GntR family transcriptional regulator [Gudongella sp.]|nr:GntR family transcriptional regulator [Gudongella sp.]